MVNQELDAAIASPVARQKRLVVKWGGGGGGGGAGPVLGNGQDVPRPSSPPVIPVVGIIQKPVGYSVPVEVPYVPPPMPYIPPVAAYAPPPYAHWVDLTCETYLILIFNPHIDYVEYNFQSRFIRSGF